LFFARLTDFYERKKSLQIPVVILCKLQKGCSRLAAASDKVYQLLTHGRWFSLGTPASSTTKTDRHDIDEILLKVALSTTNQSINQSIFSSVLLFIKTTDLSQVTDFIT
jgi:hypothetical protein